MKIVYFTHSLRSCWNHGNAHFVRGVLRELKRLGHEVHAYEPQDAWSLKNLLDDHGDQGLDAWRAAYPDLSSVAYGAGFDPAEACERADLVLVHEWNDRALVSALGRLRARGGRFTLLFHDTHHRAVSAPHEMRAYDLDAYDGVLAFGESLSTVYRRWGWGERAFTWHEAADVELFRPPKTERPREGLIWIGNWGDGERAEELEAFLLAPARAAGLPLQIHGVRYPAEALALLDRYAVDFRGWLPNAYAPAAFARKLATVHVPRGPYARRLPGIPTIRVFEALACGVPLISAPWRDAEGLFRPGEDFILAFSQDEMARRLKELAASAELRAILVRNGLRTIRERHTCAHRAAELLGLVHRLKSGSSAASTPQPEPVP